jgi:mono/diheme cytochrome c family protein
MKIATWFIVAAAAILASSHVSAADARQGHELSRQWCRACHVVELGGKGSDAAPTFHALANDSSRTREGLATWLARPHKPMPNPNLTRIEIDNIVAYILSLKDN